MHDGWSFQLGFSTTRKFLIIINKYDRTNMIINLKIYYHIFISIEVYYVHYGKTLRM